MDEFTKERLMALSNRGNVGAICGDEIAAMARQLLAGLEQKPVAYYFPGSEREVEQVSLPDDIDDGQKANCIRLYAAPQLPQPAVPSAMTPVIVDGEIIAYERHGERFSTIVGATWNTCRAAMLQGAEPDFRESAETSTKCPKCGGRGSYHCPQMLGTVECECTLPAAP